jgi:hypothetical protein
MKALVPARSDLERGKEQDDRDEHDVLDGIHWLSPLPQWAGRLAGRAWWSRPHGEILPANRH